MNDFELLLASANYKNIKKTSLIDGVFKLNDFLHYFSHRVIEVENLLFKDELFAINYAYKLNTPFEKAEPFLTIGSIRYFIRFKRRAKHLENKITNKKSFNTTDFFEYVFHVMKFNHE